MAQNYTKVSKFLSLVLRHHPELAGIQLDPDGGWAEVEPLLRGLAAAGRPLTREELSELVAADEKGRYVFSEDGRRIRACQGHSVAVEMHYEPVTPPPVLYHGTTARSLGLILNQGLRPMSRQYVHLSGDLDTARLVGGRRRGETAILELDAAAMAADGLLFYRADNGVWLTKAVPPQYLTIWQEPAGEG